MQKFIDRDRTVIIAADVPTTTRLAMLTRVVKTVPKISGIKIGIELGLTDLLTAASIIRSEWPEARKIYDHQKGGNDIPEMGAKFARTLKDSRVDAAILFPFAGPKTQREWTKACVGEGLRVMIGGIMTHDEFLVSEGGYIADDTPERIYKLAMEQGVTDFVMPGTKLDWVQRITGWLREGLGDGNYDAYAPGFITQGGDISACGAAAGRRFHPIVGSAVYGKDRPASPDEMHEAAMLCTSKLAA